MKKLVALIFFLIFGVFVYSFSITQYLYDDETEDDVSELNFVVNWTDYTLLSISGEKIFLLEENETMTDKEEIKNVLKTYYLETYYPTDEDVETWKNLTLTYNASRNDYRLSAMGSVVEEDYCEQTLLLPVYGCYDAESCIKTASLVCFHYTSLGAMSCNDYTTLLTPIEDFSYGLITLNENVDEILKLLNNITEDNVYPSLSNIITYIDEMRTAEESMEAMVFTTTCSSGSCYGWCVIDINQTVLDVLEEDLTQTMTDLEDYAHIEEVSELVYNNTNERLQYRSDVLLLQEYQNEFEEYSTSYEWILDTKEYIFEYLENDSLEINIDEIESLHTTIEEKLEEENTSGLQDEMDRYRLLITMIRHSLEESNETIWETIALKKKADTLVFLLSQEQLSQEMYLNFTKLRDRVYSLDEEFQFPVLASEYPRYYQNFSELSSSLEKLFNDLEASKKGASTADTPTKIIHSSSKVFSLINIDLTSYYLYLPYIFSFFSFISMFSFTTLLLMFILANILSGRKANKLHIAAVFMMFIILLVVEVLLTYFVILSSFKIDIFSPSFLNFIDVMNTNEFKIVADFSGAGSTDEMDSCVDELSERLLSINETINVTTYKISDDYCFTYDDQPANYTDCGVSTTTTFFLSYSSEEPSYEANMFSFPYMKVSGDESFYFSCPVAYAFDYAASE